MLLCSFHHFSSLRWCFPHFPCWIFPPQGDSGRQKHLCDHYYFEPWSLVEISIHLRIPLSCFFHSIHSTSSTPPVSCFAIGYYAIHLKGHTISSLISLFAEQISSLGVVEDAGRIIFCGGEEERLVKSRKYWSNLTIFKDLISKDKCSCDIGARKTKLLFLKIFFDVVVNLLFGTTIRIKFFLSGRKLI